MTKSKVRQVEEPEVVRLVSISAVALPNNVTPWVYGVDQEGRVWVWQGEQWTRMPSPEEPTG